MNFDTVTSPEGIGIRMTRAEVISRLGEPQEKAGRWTYLREEKEIINREEFDRVEWIELVFRDSRVIAGSRL